jgi:teichuronic acid biosynthesis glycosyltransferase TuaH
MAPALSPLPGDWTGLVVVCAATSWDGITGSEKHMARQLAAHAPVLYVDPPLSSLRAGHHSGLARSLRQPPLRMISPGLARVSPIVNPGLTRVGLRDVARVLHRRAIRQAVDALGTRPRAVIAATTDDVLDAVPADVRVLYATDDFAAGSALMGVSRSWLERCEARQMRKADLVVAISDVLAERWTRAGVETHTIPNGVEAEMYGRCDDAPVPSDVELAGPLAGFIGHLSHRIDVTLLESVADAGVPLLLVGPRQRTLDSPQLERLLSRPDVQWVGAKPFEQLPSYLGCMDVGLTPYGDSDFNRASFPLKTLEYLAGGRPVVTTDLPANAMLDPDLITVENDPASFGTAARRLAHTPASPSDAARRRAFAAEHTWAARARMMAELIGLAPVQEPSVADVVGSRR